MPDLTHAPFLLHAITDTIGGLSFVLRPDTQIQPLTPAARLVLECYGGLLLFSTFVAVAFCTIPFEGTHCRLVAAAFAFWHLWPSRRAVIRLQQQKGGRRPPDRTEQTLGGPVVHLSVHGILFMGFGLIAMFG